MKKPVVWIFICIFLITIIAIPFIIDWWIIGNDFSSNISNSDWVGFLGGYIGAILGAVFSMVGIAWTIKFTREQNRADRELQVRPCFDIRYRNVEHFCYTNTWLGYLEINAWDMGSDNNENNNNAGHVGAGLLYLRNVGNGPATNINFEVYVENIKTQYTARYTNQNTKVTTNSVLQNKTAELSIDIMNKRQAPKKEDFVWHDGEVFPDFSMIKAPIPDPFTMRLVLSYTDLMSNHFHQELVFDARYGMEYEKGVDARYNCELHLKEIGAPKITNNQKMSIAKRKEKH